MCAGTCTELQQACLNRKGCGSGVFPGHVHSPWRHSGPPIMPCCCCCWGGGGGGWGWTVSRPSSEEEDDEEDMEEDEEEQGGGEEGGHWELWFGTADWELWVRREEKRKLESNCLAPRRERTGLLPGFGGCSDSPEMGSGRWWNWARCCASPSRSRSGTPPGPCTGAGTSLRHTAGSSPTAWGPGKPTGSWSAACWSPGLRRCWRAPQR